MLPLLARRELGLGAVGYGVLLGGLGFGAIAGAVVLPRVGHRLSVNLLVFFGSLAAGAASWGALAERVGIHAALFAAAAALVVGLAATPLFPPRGDEDLDLSPALHRSEPSFIEEPQPDRGPVLVTVEYRIDPARAAEFAEAMKDLRRIARRDGAARWGLFADPARPGRYWQTFLVESWAEHARQHARFTKDDLAAQHRAESFHVGDSPPAVTHLVAEDLSRPAS